MKMRRAGSGGKSRAALRAARQATPLQTPSKPSKRDRRLIHRFKQDSQ